VYLSAEHRDLVAQDEEFDILGVVVAGSWVNICSTWRSSRYTNDAVMTGSVIATGSVTSDKAAPLPPRPGW
jgi:hypothetical protein